MATTVWKGRISFGMVSVPVRLQKAARRERIKFHHVYRASPQPEPEPFDEPEIPLEKQQHMLPISRDLPRESAQRSCEPAREPSYEPVTRVRMAPVAGPSEAPVPQQSILKGFETGEGQYAVFAPREIAALRAKTSTDLEILEFV